MDILGPRSQTLGTWLAFLVAAGWALYELRKDDQLPTGATMSSRLLPILLIATLFITAAMHVIAAVINRRRPEASEDKPPSQPDTGHEDCERKIRNLESTVARLQRNDQTQGIQISARDGQIEQLETKIKDLKWLTDLAEAQAQSIQSWVYVDCSLFQHELLRDAPYVTFQFTVENGSVYDVSLDRFEGCIHFADVLLTTEPKVITNTADHIRPGEVKQCYLRQSLTKQEVADILNRTSRFLFHDLHCKIAVQQGGTRAQDWLLRDSVDNSGLLTAYPKLEVDVTNVTCTYIVNFNTWNTDPIDGIFTMHIGLMNRRSLPVSVDTFHLFINIKGETYTAAAETGDIWEKRHINQKGELLRQGLRLDNLVSKAPLRVGQSEIAGDLQFIFKGVGAAMLNPVSYELTVTDMFGEKHQYNGRANVPQSQESD